MVVLADLSMLVAMAAAEMVVRVAVAVDKVARVGTDHR